ncbi:hypothetical protein P153DRAFT_122798 [Dothidotthia symphoricarpi CBS 119687]|uniref:C2H2 type master regulator of conidiophore development brlA n=1 Tax=Dothidotthia symphoricarpi CBS 119687 TaxID=1392245 RepID=A0A6A6A2T3_9PLEO|nr:uncharacterized protein P153DRAFT_122798 [Dothidotthia symphoricarpi CBS 119687]KAF2125217.1 hypothetical protein P153DRAFT_122798 [Dothidotthia symphoricarpi CBS 119687]
MRQDMHKLVLLLLLASLLGSAAATTTPIMDYTLPVASLEEQFLQDSDGMFHLFCDYCAAPVWQCSCAMTRPPYIDPAMVYRQLEYNEPHTSYDPIAFDLAPVAAFVSGRSHEQLPTDRRIQYSNENATASQARTVYPYAEEPHTPVPAYVTDRTPEQLSIDEGVQRMNENATTVQSSTIQAHVEDTYTPGDRQQPTPPAVSRRPPTTRQALRPGGYPCTFGGCGKAFDLAYKLHRHEKQHLPSSERRHKCSICNEGFLYPKDLIRHHVTHNKKSVTSAKHLCSFRNCGKSFPRRDNLARHERNQHPPAQVTVELPIIGSSTA